MWVPGTGGIIKVTIIIHIKGSRLIYTRVDQYSPSGFDKIFLCRGRLGSGSVKFSFSTWSRTPLPRRFPLAGPLQNELITLRA